MEGNLENFGLFNLESENIFLMKSRILGFGIRNLTNDWDPDSNLFDKDWNPVPGILNLRRGIQNPRLSWITKVPLLLDAHLTCTASL